MRIVIGGQHRKAGKTSAVCEFIRSFPAMRWTAVKVTSHGHGLFHEGSAGVREDLQAAQNTDTGRYLAAGAERAFLLYLPAGEEERMPHLLREEIASAANLIVEASSVAEGLQPDIFLMLLSPGHADFKQAARISMEKADALLLTSSMDETFPLKHAAQPCFRYLPGEPFSPELRHWLENKRAQT